MSDKHEEFLKKNFGDIRLNSIKCADPSFDSDHEGLRQEARKATFDVESLRRNLVELESKHNILQEAVWKNEDAIKSIDFDDRIYKIEEQIDAWKYLDDRTVALSTSLSRLNNALDDVKSHLDSLQSASNMLDGRLNKVEYKMDMTFGERVKDWLQVKGWIKNPQ